MSDKPEAPKVWKVRHDLEDGMSYVHVEGDEDGLADLVTFGPGIPFWARKELARQLAQKLNLWQPDRDARGQMYLALKNQNDRR